MSSDKTGLQHVPPHSHPVQPDHKPIGIMPTPKEGFGHVHSGPALISCSNLRMMLVTREDLRTVLDNTMSLEDLVKGVRMLTFACRYLHGKTSIKGACTCMFNACNCHYRLTISCPAVHFPPGFHMGEDLTLSGTNKQHCMRWLLHSMLDQSVMFRLMTLFL